VNKTGVRGRIIDEFGNFPKIPVIDQMMSAYHYKSYLIIMSKLSPFLAKHDKAGRICVEKINPVQYRDKRQLLVYTAKK
jgi:hypothetical protein